MSTFQIPPACNTKPRNTWQSFCTKLMQSRYVLRRNRVTFDHCSKRYHWSVERHSESPLTKCLPIRQEILNVSQIGVTIPWNPPTIRYADRTAIAPQMSPLLPFGLLFQQSHLFPICVALTYNDSRKNLHKICHVPRNYQRKWLVVSSSAPETSWSSSGSPKKFLFYMGRSEWNHWVAKSCTTTAYRWFLRDSISSLKIFKICGYQVTKNSRSGHDCKNTSSARSPRSFFVFKRISQFGSLGKCVYTRCLPEPVSTFVRLDWWKFMRWLWSVSKSKHKVSPWLWRITFIDQILSEILQPIRQVMQ